MSLESLFYEVISPKRRYYHVPMYLVLRGVSFFYKWIQRVRVQLYRCGVFRTRRLNARVISVGNLILGGTGKTPTVISIAETLKSHGKKPAILSRGYGGDANGEINVVSDGEQILLSAEEAGDEPVMMARHLKNVPVLTGRRRHKTGAYAIEKLGVDTLILDDGYQHLPLHRDLNILLCDYQQPVGNGSVFPAGELREPLEQFGRADVVCLTRSPLDGDASHVGRYNRKPVPVFLTRLQTQCLILWDEGRKLGLENLEGKPVAAFAGIGQPQHFFNTLREMRANVVMAQPFPDHFDYEPMFLESIEEQARKAGAECLVTTEKDAVKIGAHSFGLPLYVLRVGLEIVREKETWLRTILGPTSHPPVPSKETLS